MDFVLGALVSGVFLGFAWWMEKQDTAYYKQRMEDYQRMWEESRKLRSFADDKLNDIQDILDR